MDFNTWKQFYGWGFCDKEQLQQSVNQGLLTQEQYNEIVNPAPIKPVIPTVPVKEEPKEPEDTATSTVATPVSSEKPKVESIATTQTAAPEDTTLENIIG